MQFKFCFHYHLKQINQVTAALFQYLLNQTHADMDEDVEEEEVPDLAEGRPKSRL